MNKSNIIVLRNHCNDPYFNYAICVRLCTETICTGDYIVDIYTAGYFNTTSAIDAVQFKFVSGNIDSGVIKLYGVK